MGNYLYNGREAPCLPNYDKVSYPHLVMTVATKDSAGSGVNVGDIALCLSPYPLMFNGTNIVMSGAPERTKYLLYRYSPNNGDTEFVSKGEYSGGTTNKVTYPSNEDAFWSNHDILNSDGSVYLAASEPIPVGGAEPLDPTSMLMGWLVGRAVAAQKVKGEVTPSEPDTPDEPEKQLIGYSYNGVVLPDINEVWTDELKAEYPYAVITDLSEYGMGYGFTAYRDKFTSDGIDSISSSDGTIDSTTATYAFASTLLSDDGTTWGDVEEYSGNGATVFAGTPIWTSFDVINEDGSTYLAASDPIPVYE